LNSQIGMMVQLIELLQFGFVWCGGIVKLFMSCLVLCGVMAESLRFGYINRGDVCISIVSMLV
jgi:hypothetical protein